MVRMHLIMKNSIKSQSNIKLIKKENKQKDFYVYHDEYNGNIINISAQKIPNYQHPYIIDNSDICPDILRGKISVSKFTVGYENYEQESLSLLLKTKLVNFINKPALLYKIPITEQQEGIAFVYYKNSQLLEIIFDSIVLGNYNDVIWQQQFQLAFDEKFIIYLLDKQDPDILYGQYTFPLGNLFEEETLLIPDFHHYDPETMDICTKRYFRNYSLMIKDSFVETDYHRNKLGRINMVNNIQEEDSSHIELIQSEEEKVINGVWEGYRINVISNLDTKTEVQQFDKQLKFYICENGDPDAFEEALEFDWKDLIPRKKSHFYMPNNLLQKSIFYNGKKIRVTLKIGEENESTYN